MPPRVTRSATKQSDSPSAAPPSSASTPPAGPSSSALLDSALSAGTSTSSTRVLRKRKTAPDASPTQPAAPTPSRKKPKTANSKSPEKEKTTSRPSRGRRHQKDKKEDTAAMADQGPNDSSAPPPRPSASKRKSSNRSKKESPTQPTSSKSKKPAPPPLDDEDTEMPDVGAEADSAGSDDHDEQMREHSGGEDDEDDEGRYHEDYDEDEDDFEGGYMGGMGGAANLRNTLRALSGLVSGISSRLRDILENLKQKDDPSTQLIALQELSELLLVSTEENLSGHFSPDAYIKELVSLMQDQGPWGENAEIMLLACRCLANLMEALPAATANVVYGGAVPVLCAKLMEIQYIDLAEQSLSTLEKISVEYPTSIVREGGLTACLTYLDFFATNVQRTAVTTAANCCRNIPEDCFSTVRDVMGILLNVLQSSDQKVVEQGCICVARIAESFRHNPEKLEQLMSKELLKAVLQLLLPGTTNLVGPHIHTQFLRVLAITARASPTLSMELLKMNVVDTLYQILTGISPPAGDDPSMKNSSVMTMQALIHRPRDQIFETLNVICELLPSIPEGMELEQPSQPRPSPPTTRRRASQQPTETPDDLRRRLLKDNKPALKRFAAILLPTLTDAYTSTVNFSVRQKVLTAQLKMISNLDPDVLEFALSGIKFASHLATILSQHDQQMLVVSGLQAAELLLQRLPEIYRIQFYREGVVAEIQKLSSPTPPAEAVAPTSPPPPPPPVRPAERDEDDEEDEEDDHHDQGASSPVSSRSSSSSDHNDTVLGMPDLHFGGVSPVVMLARRFLEIHDKGEMADTQKKALGIMETLTKLAEGLKSSPNPGKLFPQIAEFFQSDEALESITSYELLGSGIIEALLQILEDTSNDETRRAFLEVFMAGENDDTPFGVLVKKLQDLLSRSEHFEIITVHRSYDGNRSSASMLAKQLRLKLVTDENSDIPRSYRNMMVSIHAIATFKALEDYLKPRIQLERSRGSRSGSGFAGALAAFAAAAGLPPPPTGHAGVPQLPPAEGSSLSAQAQPSKSSGSSRRSTRNKQSSNGSAGPSSGAKENAPVSTPPPGKDQEQLECMDEQQLPDDDTGMDDMDAVLDDLEREAEEELEAPASTVDMDPPTSKPPPRKETRSAPPQQRQRPGVHHSDSTSSSPRPMSYSAAAQSSTGEWHIQFSINGHKISNDMTIYKAVQMNRAEGTDEPMYRNVWSATHTVKFEKVPGPPPPDSPLSTATVDTPLSDTIPASLDKNKVTSSILRLLSVLHALNANIDDVFGDVDFVKPKPQPLSLFVNTKLTAKLNRQLEEPLMVASACLPSWSEDLARYFPFLFPFETRHLYLQSTSFGYSRSMTRWQNSPQNNDSRQDRHRDDNRPFLGRLQRQKVRISRDRMLESAIKVMEIYGASPSVLEVEYFEEVGTGLGPTLEFYSSVSRAFVSKKLKLWRENDFDNGSEYAYGQQGLFPAPMDEKMANSENGKKLLHLFKILGKFVARSMLDSRIIDIFFNPTFFRISDNCDRAVPPSLGAVKSVDKDLAKSLQLLRKFSAAKKSIDDNNILTAHGKQERYREISFDGVRVEDLELDFTLPGYPHIELVPDGSNVPVSIYNVGEYVDKVVDLTLASGVQRQVEAFRAGFSQVFPYRALRSFTPDELVMLFGQVEEDWSLETLMDSMKADHGYNLDSKTVRNLLQVMSEYTPAERREFLQFVTGSPKLPIGGFKALTPLLTVVCKAADKPYTADDYLPSVMTCVNYLKLPDYSTLEVLRERLRTAVKEGQGAFHLS